MFMRMPGNDKKYASRFYCDYLRTAVLFWPAPFGKTVAVLDDESEQDHAFGNNLTKQMKEHFPDRKLEVLYEPLPKNQSILSTDHLRVGYNRQFWSSYFIDLYSTDKIIAWMDTDAAFITPVTEKTIFNGKKLRLFGCECSMGEEHMIAWDRTMQVGIGLPMVANFEETAFSMYIDYFNDNDEGTTLQLNKNRNITKQCD